jgi:hypothetical protein
MERLARPTAMVIIPLFLVTFQGGYPLGTFCLIKPAAIKDIASSIVKLSYSNVYHQIRSPLVLL